MLRLRRSRLLVTLAMSTLVFLSSVGWTPHPIRRTSGAASTQAVSHEPIISLPPHGTEITAGQPIQATIRRNGATGDIQYRIEQLGLPPNGNTTYGISGVNYGSLTSIEQSRTVSFPTIAGAASGSYVIRFTYGTTTTNSATVVVRPVAGNGGGIMEEMQAVSHEPIITADPILGATGTIRTDVVPYVSGELLVIVPKAGFDPNNVTLPSSTTTQGIQGDNRIAVTSASSAYAFHFDVWPPTPLGNRDFIVFLYRPGSTTTSSYREIQILDSSSPG